jgi:type II secretory pathway component GspD/PulD (secretin)
MRFKASSKLALAVLGMTVAMGAQVLAQDKSDAAPDAGKKGNGPFGCPTQDRYALPMKTFYLKNGGQATDGNEVLTGMRLILDPQTKLFLVPSRDSIMVRGCPQDLVMAQKILDDIDTPHKRFRLDFTVTELEGGKRLGAQHVSIFVADGQRSTLKNGSRVPIATGTVGQTAQTEFTYLDIGTNFDVTTSSANGDDLTLKLKLEQSSLVEEKTIAGVQEPVVRQSVLESVSLLKEGKPQVLGAMDVPGSTRRMEIEVTAEVVK